MADTICFLSISGVVPSGRDLSTMSHHISNGHSYIRNQCSFQETFRSLVWAYESNKNIPQIPRHSSHCNELFQVRYWCVHNISPLIPGVASLGLIDAQCPSSTGDAHTFGSNTHFKGTCLSLNEVTWQTKTNRLGWKWKHTVIPAISFLNCWHHFQFLALHHWATWLLSQ